MKKALSFLLGLIMLILSSGSVFYARAEEAIAAPVSEENPFYSGQEVDFGGLDAENDLENIPGGTAYYADGPRLYRAVRDYLLKRSESFRLGYITASKVKSKAEVLRIVEKIFAGATEDSLSVGTADGDYLRLAVSTLGSEHFTLDKSENGFYYYSVDFKFTYFSTAEQERQVNKAVYDFITKLKYRQLSDYQILAIAHDYICSRTAYDDKAAAQPNSNPSAFTAYGALIAGKSTCQGYAAAFYRLCRELGYRVRIVTSSADKGRHAWNIVGLNGAFYFVDVTWDDELSDSAEKGGERKYFLVSYDNIKKNDSSNNEHLLDDKYFGTANFKSTYQNHFSKENYNRDEKTLLTNCAVSLSSPRSRNIRRSNRPDITVKSAEGTVLKKGKDYSVSYKTDSKTGCAFAVIKGFGAYSGSVSCRRYTALPAKVLHRAPENAEIA